jgi:hypothetical protein
MADELSLYLLRLQGTLQQHGASALVEEVRLAREFALGSTSEFYAEAEGALKHILAETEGILCEAELGELREWLHRINAAFKQIGGA